MPQQCPPALADPQGPVATSFPRSAAARRATRGLGRDLAFLESAAHDIRAALCVLSDRASLIADEPGCVDADDRRAMLSVVRTRSDDIRWLVDALLFAARADAGRPHSFHEASTLASGFAAVASCLQRKRSERGLELRMELTAEHEPLSVGRPVLEQLLVSLWRWAERHAEDGEAVEITSRLDEAQQSLWLQAATQGSARPIPAHGLLDQLHHSRAKRRESHPTAVDWEAGLIVDLARSAGGRAEFACEPSGRVSAAVLLPISHFHREGRMP